MAGGAAVPRGALVGGADRAVDAFATRLEWRDPLETCSVQSLSEEEDEAFGIRLARDLICKDKNEKVIRWAVDALAVRGASGRLGVRHRASLLSTLLFERDSFEADASGAARPLCAYILSLLARLREEAAKSAAYKTGCAQDKALVAEAMPEHAQSVASERQELIVQSKDNLERLNRLEELFLAIFKRGSSNTKKSKAVVQTAEEDVVCAPVFLQDVLRVLDNGSVENTRVAYSSFAAVLCRSTPRVFRRLRRRLFDALASLNTHKLYDEQAACLALLIAVDSTSTLSPFVNTLASLLGSTSSETHCMFILGTLTRTLRLLDPTLRSALENVLSGVIKARLPVLSPSVREFVKEFYNHANKLKAVVLEASSEHLLPSGDYKYSVYDYVTRLQTDKERMS